MINVRRSGPSDFFQVSWNPWTAEWAGEIVNHLKQETGRAAHKNCEEEGVFFALSRVADLLKTTPLRIFLIGGFEFGRMKDKSEFQVTIPLKRLIVGYREISEKLLRFCGGPVNSLYASYSVAVQNILISRVSIWERYLLSHSGISPLATSNHTNISVQRILKSDPHLINCWHRRKEGRTDTEWREPSSATDKCMQPFSVQR